MGNHFSGCFIYADDITLVAPSADALNTMMNVCELYAGENDITFNSNKTKMIHITINCQSPGSTQFMINHGRSVLVAIRASQQDQST